MRRLSPPRFLEYFEAIGENLHSTSEGEVVTLSSREALVFAAQAGGLYVFADGRTFAPKDLLKFFNSASSFEPIWGVCDGPHIANSPNIWAQEHKSLPSGEKYLMPVELNDEQDMARTIAKIMRNPKLADNTIIFRIESWKKGAGAEPFLEYAASRVFRDLGRFVDTQVTLSATEGTPDVVACDLPNQLQLVINSRPEIQSGVALIELAALGFDHGRIASLKEDHFTGLQKHFGEGVIAMEAKTGSASASNQIQKYLLTNLFSGVIELRDVPKPADSKAIGVLQLSETNGGMDFVRNQGCEPMSKSERQMEFLRWFECQALGYLLLNLDSFQIIELCQERIRKSPVTETEAIVHLMQSLRLSDVLDAVAR